MLPDLIPRSPTAVPSRCEHTDKGLYFISYLSRFIVQVNVTVARHESLQRSALRGCYEYNMHVCCTVRREVLMVSVVHD
jgi:hypothetical protein